jgi:hypothetical protein
MEFLAHNGTELTGPESRLESLDSVGEPDLRAASANTVDRIVAACNNYFLRRPYRRWFDPLEVILKRLQVSYYDRSACHLDLVQWATDPVWRKLSQPIRKQLLQNDIPFLRRQLLEVNLKLLLLNGSGVANAYGTLFQVHLNESKIPNTRITVYDGRDARGLRVIGWNINLQSSWGVTNVEKEIIATRIGMLI